MAIDLQQQNRVINHHHHSMSYRILQLWKLILLKVKKKKKTGLEDRQRGDNVLT